MQTEHTSTAQQLACTQLSSALKRQAAAGSQTYCNSSKAAKAVQHAEKAHTTRKRHHGPMSKP
jgi:hypothetical protein